MSHSILLFGIIWLLILMLGIAFWFLLASRWEKTEGAQDRNKPLYAQQYCLWSFVTVMLAGVVLGSLYWSADTYSSSEKSSWNAREDLLEHSAQWIAFKLAWNDMGEACADPVLVNVESVGAAGTKRHQIVELGQVSSLKVPSHSTSSSATKLKPEHTAVKATSEAKQESAQNTFNNSNHSKNNLTDMQDGSTELVAVYPDQQELTSRARLLQAQEKVFASYQNVQTCLQALTYQDLVRSEKAAIAQIVADRAMCCLGECPPGDESAQGAWKEQMTLLESRFRLLSLVEKGHETAEILWEQRERMAKDIYLYSQMRPWGLSSNADSIVHRLDYGLSLETLPFKDVDWTSRSLGLLLVSLACYVHKDHSRDKES